MSKMNILVTGAGGQLGNEIKIVSGDSRDNYIFTDVSELDITDAGAVGKFVEDRQIDMIINCAAYTNVDKAEEEPGKAEAINVKAVANLAYYLKKRDGLLVHVSTDYVFGGGLINLPLREDDPTNPSGIYGITKLGGEQAVKDTGCKYIIIRTSWLYSEYGRNFLKTMLNLTSEKPEIKVVFDQIGTPTYAYDLASVIFDITENRKFEGKEGIYHYSNEGVCSWYDFAKVIAEYAGNGNCDIRPCHSNEFPSKAVRPNYSVLDKSKIKEAFGIKIPYWTESLKICMNNLKNM